MVRVVDMMLPERKTVHLLVLDAPFLLLSVISPNMPEIHSTVVVTRASRLLRKLVVA